MRRFGVAVIVLAGLVLGACGSSTSPTASTGARSPTASGSPGTTASTSPAAAIAAANPPTVEAPTAVKTEPVIGPGTTPAPTALEMKDLVVGTGKAAVAANTVTVYYVGAAYTNGKVFDDSPWKSHAPTQFSLAQVVPGFAQGIVGMKVGGRREIVIPPALGYGADGNPPAVSPNETLVFVVDLTAIS